MKASELAAILLEHIKDYEDCEVVISPVDIGSTAEIEDVTYNTCCDRLELIGHH